MPDLKLNDGPQGFRDDAHPGTTTAWPSGLTVTATWDVALANEWGKAMGLEFWNKGANVQLGPGLNVARVPVCGRNFEYLSGEDPFLGFTMVQPVVTGIQSQGVIANAKHYVNNNQETNRGSVSENVDERTDFEIYYPPFWGASLAGVGSMMCSYNKINHVWSCENNDTLATNLKVRMGFEGWVMSDWGATHSTSINQGLDQEMPGDTYMGSALAQMVNSGAVSVDRVNDAVLRILTPMYSVGLFDRPNNNSITNNVTSDAHNALARNISAASHVLLSNSGVLPFASSVKKIAIIGSQSANPVVHGGGSGAVVPPYVVSPYYGIRKRFGLPLPPPPPPTWNCNASSFVHGIDYFQPGNAGAPAASVMDCCNQCGAIPTCFYFGWQIKEQMCWFKPDNSGSRPNSDVISGSCGKPPPPPVAECYQGKCVYFAPTDDPALGAAAATGADVAVVFLETTSSEGSDRPNLDLPNGGLVEAVAAVNKNTIVVVTTPGAALMPWANQVAAVITNFMPGQEFGNAVAEVLFGDVNPSGRLPVTMPNINNEVNFTVAQYPGLDDGENATYSENLLIGYRWYDAKKVTPHFPFGHGLSYTTFQYSNVQVVEGGVSFTLQNSGPVDGAEVAQLYIGYPSSAGEPPQVLRGFQKVFLAKGQSTTVSFRIPAGELSIWDVNIHDWSPVKGTYTLYIGSSSRDIRLTTTMTVS